MFWMLGCEKGEKSRSQGARNHCLLSGPWHFALKAQGSPKGYRTWQWYALLRPWNPPPIPAYRAARCSRRSAGQSSSCKAQAWLPQGYHYGMGFKTSKITQVWYFLIKVKPYAYPRPVESRFLSLPVSILYT